MTFTQSPPRSVNRSFCRQGATGLAALLLFLASCALPTRAEAAESRGTRWALLIGVNDYEQPGISDLKYAVPDARAMGKALQAQAGFPARNVLVMTSDAPNGSADRPTHLQVQKRLDALAQKIGPNDTFVFYFSGHGYIREHGRHFLGTMNADPTGVQRLEKTTLSLQKLREQMSRIRARQVIFLIDACRNDPGLPPDRDNAAASVASSIRTADFSRDLVRAAASARGGPEGTAVLFACAENEQSFEWGQVRHGVFTYYLLRGLENAMSGTAPDSRASGLTMTALADYVQRGVYAWCRRFDRRQRPDLQQFGAARIVLAAPPVSAPRGGGLLLPDGMATALPTANAPLPRGALAGGTIADTLRDPRLAAHDRAVAHRPNDPDAYYSRGLALFGLRDYDAAIADFDRALQLRDAFAEAFYNRAAAFFNKADYYKAILDYSRYIALRPAASAAVLSQAYKSRADAYLMRGENALALADYRLYRQARPDDPEAWYGSACAHDALGDAAEARALYRRYVEAVRNTVGPPSSSTAAHAARARKRLQKREPATP